MPTNNTLVHTHDVILDDDYREWLNELKSRYNSAKIKAALKVNTEKLRFNCLSGALWTWPGQKLKGNGVVDDYPIFSQGLENFNLVLERWFQ